MIQGETITVYQKVPGETDPFGAPVTNETAVDVKNVLVAPGPLSDVTGPDRPDGVKVVYTLHFPKTYSGVSLRGCDVDVRGLRLKVVGDPQAYTEENTPGAWNMPVEVGTVLG